MVMKYFVFTQVLDNMIVSFIIVFLNYFPFGNLIFLFEGYNQRNHNGQRYNNV